MKKTEFQKIIHNTIYRGEPVKMSQLAEIDANLEYYGAPSFIDRVKGQPRRMALTTGRNLRMKMLKTIAHELPSIMHVNSRYYQIEQSYLDKFYNYFGSLSYRQMLDDFDTIEEQEDYTGRWGAICEANDDFIIDTAPIVNKRYILKRKRRATRIIRTQIHLGNHQGFPLYPGYLFEYPDEPGSIDTIKRLTNYDEDRKEFIYE